MPTASCPARDWAGQEASRVAPLSTEAWSALTKARPDLAIDGWLRDASMTDLRPLGVDACVITAVFIRANGMFGQRSWLLAPDEVERALPGFSSP
jgi:hypothetical protein